MPEHRSPSRLWRRGRARSRPTVRTFARVGLALSVAVFVVNLAGALQAWGDPIDLVNTRGLKISPTFGDSSTEISLTVTPPDNVCPGDTTTGNFRWTTFMMPVAVDMATMTYNSQGPIRPASATFSAPLFSFGDLSPLVDKSTADTTGRIVGTTTIGFRGFTPGQVASGQYKIGYACVQEPSPGRAAITHRFWQFILTITPSETGGPGKFVWTTDSVVPSTTTSPATTSPATTSPTTTTVAPSTTAAEVTTSTAASTTVAPSSTLGQGVDVGVTTTSITPTVTSTTSAATTTAVTTTAPTTTTSAVIVAAGGPVATTTTTTPSALSAGPVSVIPAGSSLPITGFGQLMRLLVSGAALVCFGALAITSSRRRRVRAANH